MSGKAQQQSRLKELIQRGREQGYLTYAEVNDHLPEDISDPEQVEDIIRMINDMGINVFETAPDADALLLAEADTDEAAAEEAAAALAAVETDIGRTTDPVRMYMREMGTVELLTREGEIAIAKRIEEGIREVMSAIAHFPGTVDGILADYDRVVSEGGRLSDILSGYIDPDDDGAAAPQEVEPVAPQVASKAAADDKDDDEEDEESSDSDEEEGDGGPDPEVARIRFGAVAEQLAKAQKALKKFGRGSQQATDELEALAILFMPIKLVPKQYDALVERVRDALARIRAQERAIMQLCVRDARMPRADFLREFPNNETNLGWAEAIASGKSKYAEAIAARKDDIRACQQKLVDLEQETGLSVADVKDINRRMSIGEAKARRAKKEMVEANLRLVISIAKKYTNLCHLVDSPGHHSLDRRPGAHHPHPGAYDRDDQQAQPHLPPDAAGDGPRADAGRAGRAHGDARGQDPQGAEDRQGTNLHGDADRRRRRLASRRLHRGQHHAVPDRRSHRGEPQGSHPRGARRADRTRSQGAAHALRYRHEYRPHPRGSRQAVRCDARADSPDRSQGAAQAASPDAKRALALVPRRVTAKPRFAGVFYARNRAWLALNYHPGIIRPPSEGL